MSDEDTGDSGSASQGQMTLPATGPSDAERAAEARAKKAEERAKELESEKAARAEARAKKEAEKQSEKAKTLTAANERIAELEAREKAALERVAEMEKTRVEDALSTLGEDDRKRAEKYREKMHTEDFLEMVNDMFRAHGEGAPPAGRPGEAPPPVAPRGPRGVLKPQGIELHAETEALLKRRMRADGTYMKRLAEEHHSQNQYKWVISPERMIDFSEARSSGDYGRTKRLSAEQARKLLDSIG